MVYYGMCLNAPLTIGTFRHCAKRVRNHNLQVNLTGFPAFTKLYPTTPNNSSNMLLSRTLSSVSPYLVVRACTRISQPSTSRLLARSSPTAPRALFSTSPRRLAKEVPEPGTNEEAVDAFKQSSVYQKLASNPEAIQALQNFGETMKKHGKILGVVLPVTFKSLICSYVRH